MRGCGKVLCGLLVLAGLARSTTAPHSVTLTWQPPKVATGFSVVGYNVYRRATDENSFTKIATQVSGPPYEDHQVVSGQTYFYTVTAVDKSGRESRFSADIQATVP